MSVSVTVSNSSSSFVLYCSAFPTSFFLMTSFTVTKIFVLMPLCITIFYLAHQRRRRRRSSTTTNHSDFFTYHTVVLEMIGLVGSVLYCAGSHAMQLVGLYLYIMTYPGRILFQCLTCVERYLAVVHPIVYRGLRKEGGVRIRNASTGCVWLLSVGVNGLVALYGHQLPTEPFMVLLGFSLIIICYCSLSVLCALIRTGPGKVGGDSERVDQSKLRAFYTIVTIMSVLLLWLAVTLIVAALENVRSLSRHEKCLALTFALWLNLPSSLVLPLLFLHRAQKLRCCRRSMQSKGGNGFEKPSRGE